MSGGTYVVVTDDRWRFDPEAVFAALAQAYAELLVKRQGNTMNAYDWSRGWEVTVLDDHTTCIIRAPATPMIELVAWVRAFVPAEVALQLFEEELTFDPAPLPAGITAEEVRERFFPDAWRAEQMSRREPPSLEERRQAEKPPHLP